MGITYLLFWEFIFTWFACMTLAMRMDIIGEKTCTLNISIFFLRLSRIIWNEWFHKVPPKIHSTLKCLLLHKFHHIILFLHIVVLKITWRLFRISIELVVNRLYWKYQMLWTLDSVSEKNHTNLWQTCNRENTANDLVLPM